MSIEKHVKHMALSLSERRDIGASICVAMAGYGDASVTFLNGTILGNVKLKIVEDDEPQIGSAYNYLVLVSEQVYYGKFRKVENYAILRLKQEVTFDRWSGELDVHYGDVSYEVVEPDAILGSNQYTVYFAD